jgi:hypothetical protein
MRPAPRGFVCVKDLVSHQGKALAFDPAVFANPVIAGVTARVPWSAIQPTAKSAYDWSILDGVYQAASAANKIVELLLIPGYYTPSWALAQLPATEQAIFTVPYGGLVGQSLPLPVPWSTTYQEFWATFVQALATRYAGQSLTALVGVAGPTSVSDEFSLPDDPASVTLWQSLGYTSTKYVAAWQTAFALYTSAFPEQWLSIALHPCLPIDANGASDSRSSSSVRGEVISAAQSVIGTRLAIQESGLTATKTPGANAGYSIVQGYSGQYLTGFQCSTSATQHPDQMGNASDPVAAFSATIQLGLAGNVSYIQVYEPDVLNSTTAGILAPVVGQTMQNVMAGGTPQFVAKPT